MIPTKNLIAELQDHFTERGRLTNAKMAIKCYTQDASFFFSYKDGWGNKKYINLPFTPEDVLPILQKYINNIEKDIIYSSIEIEIDSEDELTQSIDEHKKSYPKTYTSLDSVKDNLKKIYAHRVIINEYKDDDEEFSIGSKAPYNIPVSSDSKDKCYQFWHIGRCKNTLLFGFNGVTEP